MLPTSSLLLEDRSQIYVCDCTEFVRIMPVSPGMRTLKTYPQSGDVPVGRIVLVKLLRDKFERTKSKCLQNVGINRSASGFSMLLALKC
jgi:hypothetical protein